MMEWSLAAVVIGFGIDLILGDPHGFPHPVILIGRLISWLENRLRRLFPATSKGETLAGAILWLLVAATAALVPALILWVCHTISPWMRLLVESAMCWQILATKSLRVESMKVYHELKTGDITRARKAVSMIVGRDTSRLDSAGVTRAAVETVAENTSDGIVAPLLFLALGGAPAGFFYKAVNTMDSMLGYIDPPYTYIGRIPAKADDIANFLPSRITSIHFRRNDVPLHAGYPRYDYLAFRKVLLLHQPFNLCQIFFING